MADASVSLGLDFLQFRAGLSQAQRSFEGTMRSFRNLAIATAGVIGVKFSFDAFKAGVKGAIAAGRELDVLSKQSGLAARDITIMTHALDRSSQSTEQTTDILTTFRDKMMLMTRGVSQSSPVLNQLGIDFEEIKKKEISAQFEDVATAVQSMQNPMQRLAVSTALFGSQGAKAVAAFQSGDVANAVKLFGKTAEAQSKASAQLARVGVSFDRIKNAGVVLFGGIAARVAPFLEFAASKLEGVLPKIEETTSRWIEGVRTVVGVLYNAFEGGKVGELLFLSLQVGVMKAIDSTLGLAKGAIQAIGEMLGQTFSVLFSKSTLKGIGDGIIGAFIVAGNKGMEIFLNVFEQPLKYLQNGFTFVFEHAQQGFTKMFRYLFDQLSNLPGATGDFFKDNMPGEYKARSWSEVNTNDKFSFGGMNIEDAKKNSELGMHLIEMAGENFAKGIQEGGGSLDAIIRQFTDGFKSAGIFGDALEDKMKQLKSLIGSLLPAPIKSEVKEEKKKQLGFGGIAQTSFDDFRRIGGGLGTSVTNIAQKQVDRLTEIRDLIKKNPNPNSLGSTSKAMNGFTPVGGY